MKNFLSLSLLFVAASAGAATQTTILSVPTMSCASCPITIKAALSKVPGVSTIKSDLAKRQTTVMFDDTKTNVSAISSATAAAGFPSTVVQAAK